MHATATLANRVKQEGKGQRLKSTQDQSTSSITTPQNSPGGVAGSRAGTGTGPGPGQQSGVAQPLAPPKRTLPGSSPSAGLDTPLTHFRSRDGGGGGGKIVTSFFSAQQQPRPGLSDNHPLAAAVTKLEDQSSGQQVLAQSGSVVAKGHDVGVAGSSGLHEDQTLAQQKVSGQATSVRTAKGPVMRSSGRSSSPIPNMETILTTSNSPSEINAMSAEKAKGVSSEEARKLRQAQQKLQKEQWQKRYGQGGVAMTAKRTMEAQSCATDGAGAAESLEAQTNLKLGTEVVGSDHLISDGKLEVI